MGIADISGTWEVKITCINPARCRFNAEWLLYTPAITPSNSEVIHPPTTFTAFITINQNGSIISGTFGTKHGLSGKVTGNVNGNDVLMIFEQTPIRHEPYLGIAKANVSDKQMRGAYSSTDSKKRFMADFIGVKKYSSIIKLKSWWWCKLFSHIRRTTKVVLLIYWIMLFLALVLSLLSIIGFWEQGRIILVGISAIIFIALLFIWFTGFFNIFLAYGSIEEGIKDLPTIRHSILYIMIWEFMLTSMLIQIIAIFLFLYSRGILFKWLS